MTTRLATNTRYRSGRRRYSLILIGALLALLVQQPRAIEAGTVTPAPATAAEINHLLETISSSACRFNRNGTWHEAAAAARHIERKYQSVRKKGLIESTDDFIAYAATASSITGNAYLVQCGSNAPIPSERWLRAALATLRSSSEKTLRSEPAP